MTAPRFLKQIKKQRSLAEFHETYNPQHVNAGLSLITHLKNDLHSQFNPLSDSQILKRIGSLNEETMTALIASINDVDPNEHTSLHDLNNFYSFLHTCLELLTLNTNSESNDAQVDLILVRLGYPPLTIYPQTIHTTPAKVEPEREPEPEPKSSMRHIGKTVPKRRLTLRSNAAISSLSTFSPKHNFNKSSNQNQIKLLLQDPSSRLAKYQKRDLVDSHRTRLINEARARGESYVDIEDAKLEVIRRITNSNSNAEKTKIDKNRVEGVGDVVDYKSPFSTTVDFNMFRSPGSKKADTWLSATQNIIQLAAMSKSLKLESSPPKPQNRLISHKAKLQWCKSLPDKLYGVGASTIIDDALGNGNGNGNGGDEDGSLCGSIESAAEQNSVNTFSNAQIITRGGVLVGDFMGENFEKIKQRKSSIQEIERFEQEMDQASMENRSLGNEEDIDDDDSLQMDGDEDGDGDRHGDGDEDEEALVEPIVVMKTDEAADFNDDSSFSDFSSGGSPQHSPRKARGQSIDMDQAKKHSKNGTTARSKTEPIQLKNSFDTNLFAASLSSALLGSTLHDNVELKKDVASFVLQQELIARRQPLDAGLEDKLKQIAMLRSKGVRTEEQWTALKRKKAGELNNNSKGKGGKKTAPTKKKKTKEGGGGEGGESESEQKPEPAKRKNTSQYSSGRDWMKINFPSYNSEGKSLTRHLQTLECERILEKMDQRQLQGGAGIALKLSKALIVPQDKPIEACMLNMQTTGAMLLVNPFAGVEAARRGRAKSGGGGGKSKSKRRKKK